MKIPHPRDSDSRLITDPSRFPAHFALIHFNHFFRYPRSLQRYVTTDCDFCSAEALAEIAFDAKANQVLRPLRLHRKGLLAVHAHDAGQSCTTIELEYAVKTGRGYELRITYAGGAPTFVSKFGPRVTYVRQVLPKNHRNHYGSGPQLIENKILEQLDERIGEVMLLLREARDHRPLQGVRC